MGAGSSSPKGAAPSALIAPTKKVQGSRLPDGTILTLANVVGLYQHHVILHASRDKTQTPNARDICLRFLSRHFLQVLASEATPSICELSARALKKLLKNDELKVGSEFQLYMLLCVWADRQVTLAAGEEWSFPDATAEAGEEAEEVEEIPDWKLDRSYRLKLRDVIAPLLPHIRFPLMSPGDLAAIEAEGTLVPRSFITEAYRHQALTGTDVYRAGMENNPRLRMRNYEVTWDPSWHGQHTKVSADGKTVSRTQVGWYAVAMAKQGYSSGRHEWAVKIKGDDARIGVTRKEFSNLDYQQSDTNSWWVENTGFTILPLGSSEGEPFARGDVIGLVLDMDELTLSYYRNGVWLGVAFADLPSNVKLHPAVGWRDGAMKLVPPSFEE